MGGRADSDTSPDTHAEDTDDIREPRDAQDTGDGRSVEGAGGIGNAGERQEQKTDDADDTDVDDEEEARRARRARWVAAGTGAVLTLAGTAAALLRLTGPAPVLVPVAYACGAAVCAFAALLGSRGRTRRALWLLVAGVMVMALGDQFD
ncbi:hypothetical protein [Streptomyces viridosporus]|uniref:Predicted protein n=1 Tax=Streptomyces viridosporus (strain ATCC 14672 / DSM 40746 / JCM 4963 / KCTC 9882 / NRRL B-12104 / FH 1290) TaxID=566461 RepID=D5ZVW9_STRV1|nr:hypothetical protein [Streptomyces viridosporus]EFE66942.1 predicted protein [Streptomyces viridosporus ATCC 14672]